MATGIGAVTTSMPLASPDERSRLPIPPLNGVAQPVFEDFHVIDMLSLQRSADDDALYRLSHIEPGTGTRGVQQPNAVFLAPGDEIAAVMTGQIIQDEEHTQRRIEAVQLLGGREWIPILPASPFWNHLRSLWTPLEDRLQFSFEPGMQDGIRTLIDWLGSQFSRGRSKQRQQFAGLAPKVLMVLAVRLSLWLKGGARMRNGLIRTRLIFTPQRQTQTLCQHIGSLNHRFFSCV